MVIRATAVVALGLLALASGFPTSSTSKSCLPASQQCRPCEPYGNDIAVVGPVTFGVDSTVYAASLNNSVFAMESTTGTLQWQFDGNLLCPSAGDPDHPCQMYTSPVVSTQHGLVFVGSTDKHMYALDASTGKRRWALKAGDFVNTDAVLSPDGKTLLATSVDGNLYALEIATGNSIWTFPTETVVWSEPTFSPDGSLVIFGATGNTDLKEHVYGVDSSTGKVKWDSKLPTGGVDSGFVHGANGEVYFKILGVGGSALMAVQTSDGKILWQSPWVQSPTQGSPKPPPVLSGGVLMHGSGIEQIHCALHGVSAANGKALWKIETDAPVVANPTLTGNRSAFFVGGSSVYKIDTEAGHVKWRAGDSGSGSAWFGTTPALSANGTVLVDSEIDGVTGLMGRLYGFDSESGNEKWQLPITAVDGPITVDPSMNRAVVSLATPVMVDAATGAQAWEGPHLSCL